MSMEAFLTMPIAFQGLVVESTSRCTAKCGMCYQAAGPKGSDIIGKAQMTEATIRRIQEQAVGLDTLAKRFHLAGGEAFLDFETCLALFAHARDVGFLEISTTTNSYWAADPKRAFDTARKARRAGLRRMEISWDFWHLPYIAPKVINNCLLACAENGINSNLRILTTKTHSAEEALGWLDPAALAVAGEVTSCPVFPTGRAASIDPAEIFASGNLASNCHSVLHLTVNARGDVAPCCAGADQTEGLTFGNVHRRSIADIAADMNRSRMLRALVFLGPGTLLGILEEKGVDIGRAFSNICHMCWKMGSNAEHMALLQAYFYSFEESKMLEALADGMNGAAPQFIPQPAAVPVPQCV